ncbi:MAG: MoaD/ThiS family protein [Deltaproteobacteria bacterium]|nr:MoaD/ThiS family protein [Deltaproteobacteria bacterium]
MSIKILFFGELSESIKKSEITLEIPNSLSVGSLFTNLMKDYQSLGEKWQNHILYAVNHTQVKRDFIVTDGDEVAFMPPMSGG